MWTLSSRNGAAGLLAALMLGLTLVLPGVNAAGRPPSAVFLVLPEEAIQPTVDLAATRGDDGRWQVRIGTTGFTFTEVCRTVATAEPVGHAHLIVDGVKVGSPKSPLAEVGRLGPGRHVIRVVLRGQDHRALIGRDGLIETAITVTEPDPRA